LHDLILLPAAAEAAYAPPVDAIEEFKVQRASVDASCGRAAASST